jgi:hypothetical protein
MEEDKAHHKNCQKGTIMGGNLKIWDNNKTIDPKYTKHVNDAGKQAFTNIDAYYLLQRATEHFGAYGQGFGLKELSIDEVHLGNTILVKLKGIFFYQGGEFPVFNSLKLMYKTSKGYDKIDEDAYKKIITNTIGKALSYLGFGADVYMGKFEDAAYLNEIANDFALEEYHGYLSTIRDYIDQAEHKDKVTAWVLKRAAAERVETITLESAKEIAKLIKQKQKRATNESA